MDDASDNLERIVMELKKHLTAVFLGGVCGAFQKVSKVDIV